MLIVSSYAEQLNLKRWLAKSENGFSIAVTTLPGWANDLWELYGNGQHIVSRQIRMVQMWKLLRNSDALQASVGMLNLLCGCAEEAAPYVSSATPGSLSSSERAALDMIESYLEQLQEANLVECSQAMVTLVKEPLLRGYVPIVLGLRPDQLSHAQHALLDACDAVLIENDHSQPSPAPRSEELLAVQQLLFRRGPQDAPVAPAGSVRLALAAGPSASNRLVCNSIVQATREGCQDIVVASTRPRELFEYAAPILTRAGISSMASLRQAFGETDLGRALVNLGQMLSAQDMEDPLYAMPQTAADFSYSPFSSISCTNAFKADRVHRRNRLTSQDAILTDLAANADTMLQGLVGLLEANEIDAAMDLLQTYLNTRFASRPAYCALQSRALETFRALCDFGPGLPFPELVQLATTITLPISLGQEGACVRFITLKDASRLDPGSVDCMVFAGLNAEQLPVQEIENARSALLLKLGVAARPDPLAQARDAFYGALEAAHSLVILQRSLSTSQGEPAQPAVVFEELMDCYREDPQTDEGMNLTLAIPQVMEPFTQQMGEQDVLGNMGMQDRELTSLLQPSTGTIDDVAKPLIVLPHRYGEGLFEGLDMSPSQIESYLECPYNWFAKRRLRLEGLDEGFSPMERGTFMHDILRRFYLRFQAEVQPKVTESTLDQARQIMRETFDVVCAEQPLEHFGRRYVPLSAWERKEQQAVLPKLLDYLEVEARLLPTFEPRAFEWQFANDRPLPYAGCNLRGCVDRIDVDPRGHAVVIDYKSSLSNEYRLRDARGGEQPGSFQLPQRLQTLMYAKVVREWFGYHVVGALYVNPLKGTVLGAYDMSAISACDIPFARKTDAESCCIPCPGVETFDQLIDDCEREVSARLEGLKAGNVNPNPAHDQACEYCPVNTCPKRRAPRKL